MKTLDFSNFFLTWYYKNRRDLPWRNTADPYQIWIAEVIFQQTRINQGIDYYNRFIKQFTNVTILANTPENEVLKLWQGLGYYSRARNLMAAAKQIMENYDGTFPSTYNEIIKLKGIGSYTAAAIASIAFNEPVAAIDGNVYRVLTRLFAIEEPIDSAPGKKRVSELANKMITPLHPGDYNQAVMELGALVCTPRNPDCVSCPVNNYCMAFSSKTQHKYPVKAKKGKVSSRYFNYFIVSKDQKILFNKRSKNDIWKGLYEFPLIETPHKIEPEDLIGSDAWNNFLGTRPTTILYISDEIIQQLSHQKIHARFYHLNVEGDNNFEHSFLPVDKKDIFSLPVPRMIEMALENIFSV